MTSNVLFLLSSSREHGNSETLARLAAESLPVGSKVTWLRLSEYPLPPFEDLRHSSGYGDPEGVSKALLEATLAADHIVFVTPVYWYSVSAPLKRLLDEWSAWLRAPNANFKARMAEKSFWGIVSTSGDDEHATPTLKTLEFCAAYFGARWAGCLLGHANKPGEVLNDNIALEAAKAFFALDGEC
jgi:multimeric flavodoxin WrbA